MFTKKVNKLPKNTIEITVNIPKTDIKNEFDGAFDRLHKNLTVPGFRQGKAPKVIAEKHIAKDAIYQELIKEMLPRIYEDLIKSESLTPIISPKIDLTKAKENDDWEIKFIVAEKPEVKLGAYKEGIKKIKSEKKKDEIWVPGKEKKDEVSQKSDNKQALLNDILNVVIKECKVEIPDLIIEQELNNRLSRLVDDIQKVGLTTDSYLKSKNLTMDSLKDSLKKEINDTYAVEFILNEIADNEKITVEEKDLDKLFTSIQEPKQRESARANAYFYAGIMKKQKTLDFLLDL